MGYLNQVGGPSRSSISSTEVGENYNSRPSDKFCVMSREFYNELKHHLSRLKTSLNLEQSQNLAGAILEMLEKKFEDRHALEAIAKADARNVILSDPRNRGSFVKPE